MIAELTLPAAPPRTGIADALRAIFNTVLLAWDRARQRRALAELDERLLRDSGISRGDARHEAARPFWDA